MHCSNGTYRYYTDEQFKDSNTGFTSRSSDFCAENSQGTKTTLADNPPGSIRQDAPANCNLERTPYKTIYKDADWLYVGQIEEGHGITGGKLVCSDGKILNSYDPYDKTIYRGTKVRDRVTPSPTPPVDTRNYAAKQKCESDYSSARAQLSIHGAGNSSAMQQLQNLHSQCLRRAGF